MPIFIFKQRFLKEVLFPEFNKKNSWKTKNFVNHHLRTNWNSEKYQKKSGAIR